MNPHHGQPALLSRDQIVGAYTRVAQLYDVWPGLVQLGVTSEILFARKLAAR